MSLTLVKACSDKGIQFKVVDGELKIKAPKGAMTSELLQQIKLAKTELINLLGGAIDSATLTPSDFPLATVSQTELEKLSADYIIADLYPATAMQSGLLFHSEMTTGAYMTQLLLTINQLDENIFKQVWQKMINRYDILRTAFVLLESGWHQLVLSKASIDWQVIDITELSEKSQLDYVAQAKSEDKSFGIVIDNPPMMRFRLFKISDNCYQVLWSHHHAIMDGWCLPLLLKEVMEHYQSQLSGKPLSLLSPFQYRHYIRWLQQQDVEQAKDFWREQLNVIETACGFPEKTADQISSDNFYQHKIDSALTSSLNQLAKNSRCTLNNIFQAAWGYLLSYYSGQSKVCFGTVISGRPASLSGVEQMIGLFINTIPTVIDIASAETVESWLPLLNKQHVSADEFGYLGLLEIQKCANIGQLFDTLMVFENYPISEAIKDDEQKAPFAVDKVESFEGTNYGLTLMVHAGDNLRLDLMVQPQRFDVELIEALLPQLERILRAMAENSQTLVSELPVLSSQQQTELLLQGSAQSADYPQNKTINQIFEQQAKLVPDKVALICGQQKLTYQILEQQANRVANLLLQQGVKPQMLVGLCVERSIDMVVGLLAILKVGGTYVPLDSGYPQARLQLLLEDTQIKHLLAQTRTANKLNAGDDLNIIKMDCPEQLKKIQLVSSEKPPVKQQSSPSDLAYVSYTSGSTGLPKGVMVPHLGVVRLVTNPMFMQLNSESVFLHASSISFDAATLEIWGPLLNGGCCVLYPEEHIDLIKLNQLIQREKVNSIWLTAGLFEQWSEEELVLPSLQWVLAGGDVLNPKAVAKVMHKLPMASLINGYGPTENTTFTCCHKITEKDLQRQSIPIGKAINGTKLYLLSAQGNLVAKGCVGELFIGGDGLAKGYLNQPELTQEKFIIPSFSETLTERLYRTGDLVRYKTDGSLEFVGRVDNQVKVRGFRIELGEVEQYLNQCPEVASSLVIAKDDGAGMKKLVAYIVSSDDYQNDERQLSKLLKQQMQQQLQYYMVPSVYILLDEWPLTANGKIDRKQLPPADLNHRNEQAYVAPRDQLETTLCQIWCNVLHLDSVGINDHFFEVGGNSLLCLSVQRKINDETEFQVSVTDLFSYPTISELVRFLSGGNKAELQSGQQSLKTTVDPLKTVDIAIVGMACRFPDADSPEQFWENVSQGVESIEEFSKEALLASGIPKETIEQPNYIKSGVVLKKLDQFDADYFGFTPREAEILDPQQRLLFECTSEALEVGGYGRRDEKLRVGVFVGVGDSTYLLENILLRPDLLSNVGRLGIQLGNSKDFAATRISHKFNLTGPSVNVNTACSTSLVAVHQARQSLIDGSCDMALAGGSSISLYRAGGRMAEEGGIIAADGRCRTFDADATGTRSGSGAGVVLLKRMAEAIADRDPVQAVIKGSAVNNDGARKVGYTAPGVEGQTQVIRDALNNSGVSADSIGYLESHGTGTKLGDPIEVTALTQAFAVEEQRQFCALGAVKPNIGHLDSAAGIAGLIKAVQVLKHKKLPPSINFAKPNPHIEFDSSPFYINQQLKEWPEQIHPRRAGVSSFGIGGTNAHVILQEAPAQSETLEVNQLTQFQLIPLSAKSEAGLQQQLKNLSEHLRSNTSEHLTDIAFTLQNGRAHHQYRSYLVSNSTAQLIEKIDQLAMLDNQTFPLDSNSNNRCTFMFPGQGSQYAGMAKNLYAQFPAFRKQIDLCAEKLLSEVNWDIRDIIFEVESEGKSNPKVNQTEFTQPGLFVIEYSLAKLLIGWGIRPDNMIGHSIGEYVAACLAGVFSLTDALRIVVKRGRLMQSCAAGKMLSISASEGQIIPLVSSAGCELAAINSAQSCVASGCEKSIKQLCSLLAQESIEYANVKTSHAFHSMMMDSVLKEYQQFLETISFHPPEIPFISNLSGDYVKSEQVITAKYWCDHLRSTVRFYDGIKTVIDKQKTTNLMIEVGPGIVLSNLAKQAMSKQQELVISTMRHPKSTTSDDVALLTAIGELWKSGVSIDGVMAGLPESAKRIALPTYPFQRKRFWVEPDVASSAILSSPDSSEDMASWFSQPLWKMATKKSIDKQNLTQVENNNWLVFADQSGVAEQLMAQLKTHQVNITLVTRTDIAADSISSDYYININQQSDYDELLDSVCDQKTNRLKVIYLWNLDLSKTIEESALTSPVGLGMLLKTLSSKDCEIEFNLLTHDGFRVNGTEDIQPAQAMQSGLCRVASQENSNLDFCHIDLTKVAGNKVWFGETGSQLLAEFSQNKRLSEVAFRGNQRWHKVISPCQLETEDNLPIKLSNQGHYFILGGLSNIGLVVAKLLAEKVKAKITLLSNEKLPASSEWNNWIKEKPESDQTRQKIELLNSIKLLGGELLILNADVTDRQQMEQAFDDAEKQFGGLSGVIYCSENIVQNKSPVQVFSHDVFVTDYYPELTGIQVIEKVLSGRQFDFCLLMSSLTSILGGPGLASYSTISCFIDAVAHKQHNQGDQRWLSINWDNWDFTSADKTKMHSLANRFMSIEEGAEAIELVLNLGYQAQVINSKTNLMQRLKYWDEQSETSTINKNLQLQVSEKKSTERENYVPAGNQLEKNLVDIWQTLLGVESIGIKDNFFDLGGDSLLATRVFNMLKKHIDLQSIDFTVGDFFNHSTIEDIAQELLGRISENQIKIQKEKLIQENTVIEEGEF